MSSKELLTQHANCLIRHERIIKAHDNVYEIFINLSWWNWVGRRRCTAVGRRIVRKSRGMRAEATSLYKEWNNRRYAKAYGGSCP